MLSWQRLVLWQIVGLGFGCSNVHPATLPPCDECLVVFDGGMNTTDGGTPDAGSMIPRLDGGIPGSDTISLYRDHYGVTLWTEQMVREVYQTPHGWTRLVDDLRASNRSHEPPLQDRYVGLFSTLEELVSAAVSAYPQVGTIARTISISTVWHMWEDNPTWPVRFRNAVMRLVEAGYHVRLVLLHKESYPANLHVSANPERSGWAHEHAAEYFVSYVDRLLNTLADVLPANSTITLALEAESALWEGMVGSGKWPPGATNAGHGLAQALINLRDALRISADLIRSYRFKPAIGVGVSPLLPGTHHEGEGLLDYLRTWWLADNLATGVCAPERNQFDPSCTRHEGSVLNTVGLTFYGGMWSHSHHLPFGIPGVPDVPLAMMVPSLQPDAALFGDVLGMARSLYPHADIEVAEIGFSHARVDTQVQNLINYKRAIDCKQVTQTTLHTLFMGTTEFQQGEWQFGLIENCDQDLECILTERGELMLTQLRYPPIPNPCNP